MKYLFSTIFEDIQKDSDRIWKNMRYELINRCVRFDIAPPPLNLFLSPIKYFMKQEKESIEDLKSKLSEFSNRQYFN